MTNALMRQDQPMAAQIEQVVISGDLKNLTSAQRVDYYNRVCQSVGLNPYTRPFDYITLNGKLTLYARRDAADQLRSLHGISLSKPHIEYTDDMVIVTVEAVDKEGRTDTDLGAVNIKNLQGEARANAIMKAITKAKRRVTLSLAGLGWLDETEVDTIPGAQRVTVDTETGEILEATATKPTHPERTETPKVEILGALAANRDVNYYKETEPPQQAQEATGGDNGQANASDPTADELVIIKQWANRTEAEMWAVMVGACENEYEAANSMNKSIGRCGGKVTKENYLCVYVDFYRRQQEKLAQEQKQAA